MSREGRHVYVYLPSDGLVRILSRLIRSAWSKIIHHYNYAYLMHTLCIPYAYLMHTLVSYQYPSLVTSPRAPCERVESGDTRVSSPAPGLGTRLAVSTVRACVQLSLLKRGGSLVPDPQTPPSHEEKRFSPGGARGLVTRLTWWVGHGPWEGNARVR